MNMTDPKILDAELNGIPEPKVIMCEACHEPLYEPQSVTCEQCGKTIHPSCAVECEYCGHEGCKACMLKVEYVYFCIDTADGYESECLADYMGLYD